jgi:isopropylmalate/homocitrate/citramalate synthase
MPRIDGKQLWTGKLNAQAVPKFSLRHAGLYDTTLRDGEQAVGVVFEPKQKLELARLLDEMGVDRIEAGFPRVSDDDRRAIQMILRAGLRAEVWGFSRALTEDVQAVVELGLRFTVIEAPISDLKLEALGLSREAVMRRITTSITQAAKEGIRVAFFGVDGSRADLDFFDRIYRAAVDAGAAEVVVVDTLGIATPELAALLVRRTVTLLGAQIPVHFHGHNDFGLATASAVAAVVAGASWIHGTVDGIGERAGNANLAQVALTLDALYGVETNLNLGRVRRASAMLRQLAGYQLEPWKPVVGDNLFVRETGAVAAQFHIPQAIEPYSSAILETPRKVVMGKKSGLASIRIKCEELGVLLPEEKHDGLLADVKALAIRKRGLVSDAEFLELVTVRTSRN